MKLDIDSEYEMAAHNIDSLDHKQRPSHRTEPGDEGVDTRDWGSGLRRVSLCHPDTPVWSPRRHPRLSVQLQSRSAPWGNFQTRNDKKREISTTYLFLPPNPRLNGNFTYFPPGMETSVFFIFSTLMASLSYCFSPFHSIFRCGQQVGGADWEKHSSSQC